MNAPMIFVRGASGAGKSTFAEEIRGPEDDAINCLIFETDNFFKDAVNNHDYHFNANLLKFAHNWNQGEVIRFARDCPTVPIVVANTFCQMWELKPYFEIAKMFNRSIFVFTLRTEHDNVHNVPDETVKKHRLGLQHFEMADWVNDYPVIFHREILTDVESKYFSEKLHEKLKNEKFGV